MSARHYQNSHAAVLRKNEIKREDKSTQRTWFIKTSMPLQIGTEVVFHLSPSFSVSHHRASHQAMAVDFHFVVECAVLPDLVSSFEELKWTHIDRILTLVLIYYMFTLANIPCARFFIWKRSAGGGLSFLCTPLCAELPRPVFLSSLKGSGSASFVVHKSRKTTSWQEPG